jgi:uncharacterized protein YsxB (DUF464 family)
MIRVNYLRKDDTHKLSVQGHAGWSQHGNDIVCAGVSAISFALLGYLHNAGCDIAEAQADSGNLLIECSGDKLVAGAFDMAMVGYLQIAKKYPQHVDVYIAAQGG